MVRFLLFLTVGTQTTSSRISRFPIYLCWFNSQNISLQIVALDVKPVVPQTSSTNITYALVRNAESQTPLQMY